MEVPPSASKEKDAGIAEMEASMDGSVIGSSSSPQAQKGSSKHSRVNVYLNILMLSEISFYV
ncbi:hypothetical protein KL86DYS1_31337 [uncultured Dysgonomonas sp.]|uniref:Uncharacterized protein n=1 Tax=uncultured Dysgonomonas sp. TaxID=206096 RepID=A0A212K3L3_9BACT|nr:hypothetical protein KL86DYS1_31337 [uncultured Dysgonomonas sp.]